MNDDLAARLQAAEVALKHARDTCDGSCDIALARRQVGPDGVVPGNARECAEMWEAEASRLWRERRDLEDLAGRRWREIEALDTKLATAIRERDEAREALRREKAETERLRLALTDIRNNPNAPGATLARIADAALQPQGGEAGGEACAGCFDRKVRLWTVHGPNGPEPMREDPCSFCQPAPPARAEVGCGCADGGPGAYEGPAVDCPEHGKGE